MNVVPLLSKPPFSAQVAGTVTDIQAKDVLILNTLVLYNTTAAVAYLQIFNLPAASVTLGTTVPVASIPLPANGGTAIDSRWKVASASGGVSVAGTTTRTGLTGAAIDVFALYE